MASRLTTIADALKTRIDAQVAEAHTTTVRWRPDRKRGEVSSQIVDIVLGTSFIGASLLNRDDDEDEIAIPIILRREVQGESAYTAADEFAEKVFDALRRYDVGNYQQTDLTRPIVLDETEERSGIFATQIVATYTIGVTP